VVGLIPSLAVAPIFLFPARIFLLRRSKIARYRRAQGGTGQAAPGGQGPWAARTAGMGRARARGCAPPRGSALPLPKRGSSCQRGFSGDRSVRSALGRVGRLPSHARGPGAGVATAGHAADAITRLELALARASAWSVRAAPAAPTRCQQPGRSRLPAELPAAPSPRRHRPPSRQGPVPGGDPAPAQGMPREEAEERRCEMLLSPLFCSKAKAEAGGTAAAGGRRAGYWPCAKEKVKGRFVRGRPGAPRPHSRAEEPEPPSPGPRSTVPLPAVCAMALAGDRGRLRGWQRAG